jgi:O-antigen/teichoic acid export membrane protein
MASFAVLAIVGIAAAPLIVHLLFGDRYHDSVPIARILMFGIFIAIPGAQFEILFRSTSDERRLYIQRITYAVCELTLVAAGSFVFGIRGAAWASVVANGVNSISGFVLDRRR